MSDIPRQTLHRKEGAGSLVLDIADPAQPKLVSQTLFRGYIYLTHKNQSIHILRLTNVSP